MLGQGGHTNSAQGQSLGSLCPILLLFITALFPAGCGQQQTITVPVIVERVPFSDHVGSTTCIECHEEVTRSFRQSPMGSSLELVGSNTIHKPASFTKKWDAHGIHAEFLVRPADNGWTLTEVLQAGRRSEQTERLTVAVGSGNHGKTFLIEKPGGFLFEAPASWYRLLDGWELSPGYESHAHPGFGRPILEECLFCHSGGAVSFVGTGNGYRTSDPFLEHAISCERCHASGAEHVRRQQSGVEGQGFDTINPAKLAPKRSWDACLQCHRSEGGGAFVLRPGKDWYDFRPGDSLSDVAVQFRTKLAADEIGVHFSGKPTQLATSKCFQGSAGAMTCLTCHRIHERPEPKNKVSFYRQRCLECHSAGCPLPEPERMEQGNDCVACHMPAVVPADITHSRITDHRIRIPQTLVSASQGHSSVPKLIGDGPTGETEHEKHRNLGIAYLSLSRENHDHTQALLWRAINNLDKANRIAPLDPQGRLALAQSFGALGQPQHALEHFEAAVKQLPDSAEAHLYLGICLTQLGQSHGAAEHLERSLKFNPYQLEAIMVLAGIYEQQGKIQEAAELKQRAITIDHRAAFRQ